MQLVDGTPAKAPPVALDGVAGRPITTRAEAISPRSIVSSSAIARCLDAESAHIPLGPVVSRVGVDGASVTFRAASGAVLIACDGVASDATDGRPWCGTAVGRLRRGRLLDARLDLAGCQTADGDPVAFAWIEPHPRARYVVVQRRGFVEVYPSLGRLPVRVATAEGVDHETSSVTFEISEHDSTGHQLREYTVVARVAG